LTLIAAEDNFIQSVKLKFQIPWTGAPVTGIATLGNDLFVIRTGQRQIGVYDAETGIIRRTLRIPYIPSQQSCLAACGFHKCLYVYDEHNGCIQKASSIEQSETVTVRAFLHMVYYTGSVASLEVTKNHNLLVACYNDPKLLEYSTYGVLVREVNLNISNPVCVAQLHTGLYGVIHLDAQNYHYSVMDTNGEVIKHSPLITRPRPVQYVPYGQAFREEYEDVEPPYVPGEQLAFPEEYEYEEYDDLEPSFGSTPFVGSFRSTTTLEAVESSLTVSRSGTVFIATGANEKILVLREIGDAFKVESLPESAYGGTLNEPHCVHFDDSKKRLYIGEGRGGRVLCCSAERK